MTIEEKRERDRASAQRYRERNRALVNARTRAYRAANHDHVRDLQRDLAAAHPERGAEYSRRYRERHLEERRESDRLAKAARPEVQRAWVAANRDRVREKYRRYRASHPEKVREYNHTRRARLVDASVCSHWLCTTFGVTQTSWGVNDHSCWMCGRPLVLSARRGQPAAVAFDHVIPLAKGGAHCADNVRPACEPCNAHKAARVLAEVVPW